MALVGKQQRQRSNGPSKKTVTWRKIFTFILVTLCLSILISLRLENRTQAAKDPRIIERKFIIQAKHWQLAQWGDGTLVCDIYIEHDQQPTYQEVYDFCGYNLYLEWVSTPPCKEAAKGGNGTSCDGLFHRYVGETTYTYKKEVALPEIKIKVTNVNCIPGEWCETLPLVKVVAYEPLSDYRILKVYVRVGGRIKVYDGSDGQFSLPLTGEQGDWLEYWAESEFGDQSEHIAIQYRSFQPDPGMQFYRFDLLGEDWAAYAAPGSLLWGIFPPADLVGYKILDQPLSVKYLFTTNRYIYLASHLIQSGFVDASQCPNGGFYSDGSANPCGENASADQLLDWQNQYDENIFEAAKKYNIPARVLKGIISQESQFWPISDDPYELGLGKITENGADLLMMWHLEYYLSACTPIYNEMGCAAGFGNLNTEQQKILHRTVLDKVGTPDEIDMLAAILYASAAQINQMVRNTIEGEPSETVDFVEMWKFTIGNYYIGSGCISVGMQNLAESGTKFTWTELVNHMVGDCQNAKHYVDNVMHSSD